MKPSPHNHYDADCIVIGAGMFGLYTAQQLVKKNKNVIVVEQAPGPFTRASAINQARVHNGYHYPRSSETAVDVSRHYGRFLKDFEFAVNSDFQQVYAIARENSKVSSEEFVSFCNDVGISLKALNPQELFRPNMVEAAFITEESSYDFQKIRDYFLKTIGSKAKFIYGSNIISAEAKADSYLIRDDEGRTLTARAVFNATYVGINRITELFHAEPFDVKYELCEVAFCDVPPRLKNTGITVLDGDYFSLMPFGDNAVHTLTSVEHTPNKLQNPQKPFSSWNEMYKQYRSYMQPNLDLSYKFSKYESKTILTASEEDDSRPTIIKVHTKNPTFISILSGKISTIYDVDKYIEAI